MSFNTERELRKQWQRKNLNLRTLFKSKPGQVAIPTTIGAPIAITVPPGVPFSLRLFRILEGDLRGLSDSYCVAALDPKDGWASEFHLARYVLPRKEQGERPRYLLRPRDVVEAMLMMATIKVEGESIIEARTCYDPCCKRKIHFFRIRTTPVVVREILLEQIANGHYVDMMFRGYAFRNRQTITPLVTGWLVALFPEIQGTRFLEALNDSDISYALIAVLIHARGDALHDYYRNPPMRQRQVQAISEQRARGYSIIHFIDEAILAYARIMDQLTREDGDSPELARRRNLARSAAKILNEFLVLYAMTISKKYLNKEELAMITAQYSSTKSLPKKASKKARNSRH